MYVGLNAGGAWQREDTTTTMTPGGHIGVPATIALINASGTGSATATGFIGGAQAGYNWQVNQAVFGLEVDIDGLSGNPTLNGAGPLNLAPNTFTMTNSVKAQWMATVRPRLGVVFDRTLVYATGGLAMADIRYTQTYADTLSSGFGTSTTTTVQGGWTAGGGIEQLIWDRWSVKLEYLYAKFSSIGTAGLVTATTGNTNVLNGSADLTIQTVRAGINWKFN
jgi:outer membrane immunogenic protein